MAPYMEVLPEAEDRESFRPACNRSTHLSNPRDSSPHALVSCCVPHGHGG